MSDGGFTRTEAYLLHQIVFRLDQLAKTASLDAHGLTYTEFLLALTVREQHEPSQSEVAELLDYSNSMVSQKVARLCDKGILVQRRDEVSRRVVRLSLTARGEQVLDEVYAELVEHASRIFDQLGPRRAAFRTALADVVDALRAAAE